MGITVGSSVVSRNPATGEVLAEIEVTRIDALPGIFARGRDAQRGWAVLPIKKRAEYLRRLAQVLSDRAHEVTEIISRENGKPRVEALANEILASLATITYFARKGPGLLKDRSIPLVFFKHRRSSLDFWPLGIVAVISPWNYPLMEPLARIAMALLCGNAVIFKPSEVTPLVGMKIQELCDAAGFPPHLLQTVFGDGEMGAAVIDQKPAKIFFIGSSATGRKVMRSAAALLIPVNLELGGKDAMIVCADADLDFATSCAAWGGYANGGQACSATERILVAESIAGAFTSMLKGKLETLRQGPSVAYGNDLGPITCDRQASVYELHLDSARRGGAQFVLGGALSEDRRFMPPTIVAGERVEELDIYNEETFGPVVAITTFRSVSEVIQKANRSHYGLAASVITRDLALGERIARQLEVGSVVINESGYTGGLAETPWGGVKDSGFGRIRSDMGIYEFVNVRHIHTPRSMRFVFKPAWWFPYSRRQYDLFHMATRLFDRSWIKRFVAFPRCVWTYLRFMASERRL